MAMEIKKTKIEELVNIDKKHFLHPSTNPKVHAENGPPIIFTEGNGIFVKDVHGDTYMDAMSMLWNVNLGHGVKELAEVGKEQIGKLAYASAFKGFSNEPAIELSKKLADIAPGDLNAVFYTSGGSESNDTAIKLSRYYWGIKGKPEKIKIIALNNAYHGVTVAAQTATGIPAFHDFARSNIEHVHHAKAHLTNCENGDKNDPDYAQSIRGVIEREGADTVAAVLLEPVQGAGGVHIPPEGYLQAVRKLCDEHNILFIADEVICGFGRTGTMFGVENWDVVPDLMSIAKGISSGYAQLGGVLINDEVKQTLDGLDANLSHGFTYSGHASACAIGLKNIEIMERDGVVENAKKMEAVLKDGLAYLEDKHSIVTNSRAIGLLAAIEIYEDRDTGKLFDPKKLPATTLVDEFFANKLILRALGSNNEIIAIAPPLTITKEEVEKMIAIMDESITSFRKTF